jgi:GTP cyclohydrolase I
MIMVNRETVRKLLEEMDGGRGIINEEVMANTPDRVARMYNNELLAGYETDPSDFFARTFDSTFNEMVVETNITFSSLCEHHLLPITGTAHVGYLPREGRLVGLSKLSRIVDCYARRLQLQERIASEVADAFMKHLDPVGVGVVIEAEHGCMSIRGVKKPRARTVVSAMRGSFLSDPAVRQEFLELIQTNKRGG